MPIRFPIHTRFKQANGRWSAETLADTLAQAHEHVAGYESAGFTEIEIVDNDGQPLAKENLGA